MKRLVAILAAACLCAAVAASPALGAETEQEAKCLVGEGESGFGFCHPDVSFEDPEGNAELQAGAHPFAMNTYLVFRHHYDEATTEYSVDQDLKDFFGRQIAGLAGDSTATHHPRCSTADFLTSPELNSQLYSETACDENADAVGAVVSGVSGWLIYSPLLNLEPPPGVAARLGWDADGLKVILDVGLERGGEYRVTARQVNLPQLLPVVGAKVQIWGVPGDSRHDDIRGRCLSNFASNATGSVPDIEFIHGALYPGLECPSPEEENPWPLLTMPTRCGGPLPTGFAIDSWLHPGALIPEGEPGEGEPDLSDPAWMSGISLTHDLESPPAPQGVTGCGKLGLHALTKAQPTSRAAQSPSGLDFSLEASNPGFANSEGLADSDIEKTVVALPEGMTINPSQAEGLEVCSEADLARETLAAEPGQGCPQASKIGTVEVESPEAAGTTLHGSLFVAKPYENPTGSLIALYMVIKNVGLGAIVKQPLRVEPDPRTGQLLAYAENLPQIPLTRVSLHLREGGRAPLITPPGCGSFQTSATLYPYSGNPPVTSTSTFRIVSGPNESPCPSGRAPFHPGFEAGTQNNAAGAYSPFDMRITRADGEQDMGKFSFVLPPGVVPKLAGIPYCSEADIAQAISRQGPHGGQEEIEHPSCPAASQIGRTVAGAGVGSQLTYVSGKLYLAGPYHGDPISAVSITPAVAGPFDAGVVVVREGLRLNPVTYVGEVDGSASDPIPHILKGIPLNVREIQVLADRPEFTLNATSCEPFLAQSTIWGDGTTLAPGAETPAGLSSRYQAADCASLGFKPKLGLKLRGGTERGKFPALHAVYTPRAGDANLSRLALLFPHSEFIEQGHFRTICTRVQFAAAAGNGEACPAGSVYGHVRAWSPLLAQPLEGPVYLRSSSHNLPDAVLALHGLVDIDVVVRIDSKGGGLRATVEGAPDAPVSRAIVDMQGGRKGLFINSTDLCKAKHRAKADATGQNGKVDRSTPLVRTQCGKHKKKAHRKRHKSHHKHRSVRRSK